MADSFRLFHQSFLNFLRQSFKKLAAPAEALAKAGAEGRTRTDMVLPPRDFESRASAISPLRLIKKFNIILD